MKNKTAIECVTYKAVARLSMNQWNIEFYFDCYYNFFKYKTTHKKLRIIFHTKNQNISYYISNFIHIHFLCMSIGNVHFFTLTESLLAVIINKSILHNILKNLIFHWFFRFITYNTFNIYTNKYGSDSNFSTEFKRYNAKKDNHTSVGNFVHSI